MDPIEFWSNRMTSIRTQGFSSKPLAGRSRSIDREDPLSVPSPHPVAPPSHTPQHSRIAVLLKAPSNAPRLVFESSGNSESDLPEPEPVLSDVSPRVKKQTPVPLPRTVHSLPSTPVGKSGFNRGRPRGWKPGMSYAAMRGSDSSRPASRTKLLTAAAGRPGRAGKAKPAPVPSGNVKRRGRPPKAVSPPPSEVYQKLQAPFAVFLCEWVGCKAELHNLDTLRRHVYAVHRGNGPTVCLWGKCGRSGQHNALPDARAFRAHVEEGHLVPLSWHVGDGPQNNSGVPEVPAAKTPDYLMDEQGNQVTPSIRHQEVEDLVTWRNNRRKLKELFIRMNENLPSDESDSPFDDD